MQERAQRYGIKRPVEFRLRSPGIRKEGTGQTLNISTGGILFETQTEIDMGRKIDLTVDVGDALGGGPVTLHIQGVTVRTQDGTVAVLIKKHRLRPIEEPDSV
jgi:hypothetical protein